MNTDTHGWEGRPDSGVRVLDTEAGRMTVPVRERTAFLARLIIPVLVVLSALVSGSTWGEDLDRVVGLRRQYNAVSARIDSIVRAMRTQDASTLETAKLPDASESPALPDDADVVAIFWADDEAKVWINDHFVGETRLTPVEVVIPNLYS